MRYEVEVIETYYILVEADSEDEARYIAGDCLDDAYLIKTTVGDCYEADGA